MADPEDWAGLAPLVKARIPRGEQKVVASRLGISEVVLSRYLSGERVPDPVFLLRLSRALSIPVSELLGEAAPIPPLPKDLRWDIEAESEKEGIPFDEALVTLLRESVKARQLGLRLPYVSGELPADLIEDARVHGVAAAGLDKVPELIPLGETTDLPSEEVRLAERNGWKLIQVLGNSMEPVYKDGDYIWMAPRGINYSPARGEDLVIWWEDGLQIKRFDPDPDKDHRFDRYVPLNREYQTLVRGKASRFRVYGSVVRLAKRDAKW